MLYISLAVLASLMLSVLVVVHIMFEGSRNKNTNDLKAATTMLEEGEHRISPITNTSSKQKKLWKQLARESYAKAISPNTPCTPSNVSLSQVFVHV
jgi:hypothetical protein